MNCIKMVVTMNPCPCGYYGNITNYCICSYIIGEL
ncbi:MAG: ATP-binding protein [Ruminococcus sp.]|nr:ATP-binding protein [Ruminococcus sp.]